MSSDNKTIKFLNNFVNRVENLKDLIHMYIETSNSRAGALFIQKGKTQQYTCLEHINLDYDIEEVKFKPLKNVENITTENLGLTATYEIKNILIIPIKEYNNYIGVVCLLNNSDGYMEENVNEIYSSYISLTQLILGKHKILNDYKDICYNDYSCKDLFLANMSHEIRTPANGVIGYGQLLMQTELNSTQRGYLQSQNQCCIQLMQIINDILDFSKLSSGKMGINTECFSISEILEIVRGTLEQRIIEKKQKIKFVIGEEIPEFIILDKQKLIQILVNLISNAYKFTDIGGYIEVRFHIVELGILQITVKDNGIGISEKDQFKLFSAFEQIQTSVCKSGTGLGLTICEKLVRLLGGQIDVKSTLGVGSTFIVKVKYKPYEDYERNIKRDAKLLKNKVILVVDDNADNRILLTELLFEWEMKPIVCASALEALRMVMANRYNFSIGLIDICMPGITGTELAKQIKEERPFFPLVALSSIDTFITTQEFEQKLDKPINKVQLFNAIHRILSKEQTPSAYIGEETESSSDNFSPSSNFNKNIKILIVEDIIYNRNMLENMILSLKYTHVDSAENGKIALNMLHDAMDSNEPYDIILLDLRMPLMNGYELIETIKRKNWNLPKIIVVTASVIDEDKQRCKQLGVKYFITKPINMIQLKNVLLHVSEIL